MRTEFPKQVKVARLRHATKDGVICCEGCGVMVKPGEFAFDHDRADGLLGKPVFENCRVLCVSVCHSAKTKLDDEAIARAKRQEEVSLGIRSAPTRPMAKRPPKPPKRAPRPALPPRQLYKKVT